MLLNSLWGKPGRGDLDKAGSNEPDAFISGIYTRRDWLSCVAFIAQVTLSFEGTKAASQYPNLVTVKHLKENRPDNASLAMSSTPINWLGCTGCKIHLTDPCLRSALRCLLCWDRTMPRSCPYSLPYEKDACPHTQNFPKCWPLEGPLCSVSCCQHHPAGWEQGEQGQLMLSSEGSQSWAAREKAFTACFSSAVGGTERSESSSKNITQPLVSPFSSHSTPHFLVSVKWRMAGEEEHGHSWIQGRLLRTGRAKHWPWHASNGWFLFI